MDFTTVRISYVSLPGTRTHLSLIRVFPALKRPKVLRYLRKASGNVLLQCFFDRTHYVCWTCRLCVHLGNIMYHSSNELLYWHGSTWVNHCSTLRRWTINLQRRPYCEKLRSDFRFYECFITSWRCFCKSLIRLMINRIFMALSRNVRRLNTGVSVGLSIALVDSIATKLFDPSTEFNNEPNSNLCEFKSMLFIFHSQWFTTQYTSVKNIAPQMKTLHRQGQSCLPKCECKGWTSWTDRPLPQI